MLVVLSVQVSGIKHIHTVGYGGTTVLFQNTLSSQTETPYPGTLMLHSLLPPAPGIHHSTLCLCEFDHSEILIEVESSRIYLL